jgi:glucosylceramidase
VLLWNLALDENHGPVNGGCTDCRGVVTINAKDNCIERNVEYYVLGHASKFVRPGAFRINSAQPDSGALAHVAFENPGGSIALLVLNKADTAQTFQVQDQGKRFSYTLHGGSVVTFTWKSQTQETGN